MAKNAEQLEQLTAYLDGELAPAQRAEVDRLLAEDPDARSLLQELQQTSRLVSALPREAAPGGLADAVVNRMERRDLLGDTTPHQVTASPAAAWARRFAVAASIALVGTAVWIAWPHFSQLMIEKKQPLQLASAEKSARESTPAQLQGRGQSELDISRSLRPSPRPTFGDAPVRSMARSKTPMALGYVGDSANQDARAEEPDGDDEAMPISGEQFVTKMDHLDMQQPVAPSSAVPEPVQSMTVEADAATIGKLTALVERDMARHAVPMIQADTPGTIAQGEGAFFTVRHGAFVLPPPSSAGTGSPPANSGNEVRIVMRAPRDVAEQTLTSMYRISKEADASAGWTTAGRLFGPPRAAGRAPDGSEEEGFAGGAGRDAEETEPPTLDRLEKKRATAAAEPDADDAKKEEHLEERDIQTPARGRRRTDSASSTSQPVPPKSEPLVTLTIHLRARPTVAAAAATPPSTQPTTAPTSQVAPRATTQEVPGG